MTRIAAHGRNADENRATGRRKWQAGVALGALALALGLASEVRAQSNSGIYINNDVLNSLGPGLVAAPLAPAAPPTPLSPRSAVPQYQPPAYQAPAPQGGSAGRSFQSYGSGNVVVTRPGTLLFPPLEAPNSRLAPGFSGTVDNHAARAEALTNAFAEGPEPSSQLLIPLDNANPVAGSGGDGSVIVNLDALPPADPYGQPYSGSRITLIQPPMQAPAPAPRKPEVPAAMLAEIELAPIDSGPAELAPEFQAPAPTAVADLPAPESAPMAAMAREEDLAGTSVDETPEPALAAAAESPAEPTAVPVEDAPASSAAVPAPVAVAEVPPTDPAPQPAPAEEAPVSLLPARDDDAMATDSETPEPAPAGLQTASLTVGGVGGMTFLFDMDSTELSDEVQIELRSLADTMRSNEAWIQVLGFASGTTATGDQARKLALSRALKVRSFLIDAGIASARIQVRSLGDRAEGGPANRVDIKPIGS